MTAIRAANSTRSCLVAFAAVAVLTACGQQQGMLADGEPSPRDPEPSASSTVESSGAPSPGAEASIGPDGARVAAQCADREIQPTRITIACADAGNRAVELSWQRWGASEAVGSGVHLKNDCQPSCLGGTFRSEPARFRLFDVQRGMFTQIEVTGDSGPAQTYYL